jgi:hypothetical protein
MKLPPIWAESPPFESPERMNSIPPAAAERIKNRPRSDASRTALDLDQANESAKTTTESTVSSAPSARCQTARPPRLSTEGQNPANDDRGDVVALAGRKMLTVSPDQPCTVKITSVATSRTLNPLLVTTRPTVEADGVILPVSIKSRFASDNPVVSESISRAKRPRGNGTNLIQSCLDEGIR